MFSSSSATIHSSLEVVTFFSAIDALITKHHDSVNCGVPKMSALSATVSSSSIPWGTKLSASIDQDTLELITPSLS